MLNEQKAMQANDFRAFDWHTSMTAERAATAKREHDERVAMGGEDPKVHDHWLFACAEAQRMHDAEVPAPSHPRNRNWKRKLSARQDGWEQEYNGLVP